jgi:phosphoribosylformimino-5-aminoimidazole carboxamide ribotide isomerase
MTIIPAIDLLGGRCVRLYKGRYDESVTYNDDPVKTAEAFCEAGARRIHVVDLDAARSDGSNRTVLREIRRAVPAVIETGGGIRSEKDVEELLEAGADRLILGTVLVRNPDLVEGWIRKYGPRFIAGIDALNGLVKVAGWEKSGGVSDLDLASRAAELGFISIIYTNIDRDGTLEGPDLERTLQVAEASGLPVIVSGGISGIGDCQRAARHLRPPGSPGITGIITGKAVYEGRIDLAEAVKSVQTDEEEFLW